MSIIDEPIIEKRKFEVGTTGWTAADLDDPDIEHQWLAGRYEIVEGVLTKMAPSYYTGGSSLVELLFLLRDHLRKRGIKCGFATECDVICSESRIARCDAVLMNAIERDRQNAAARAAGNKDEKRTRILIPPTLVIESISPGHEKHDYLNKRRWYAEFGVPNYWIINAFKQTLDCYALRNGQYEVDVSGEADQTIQPASFPGLAIPLIQLWAESA